MTQFKKTHQSHENEQQNSQLENEKNTSYPCNPNLSSGTQEGRTIYNGTKIMDANSKPIVSKQTFAAIVQAKLPSLNSGEAQIEIQHGTHLGKPAVFFKAEDYFVKLTKECKFTIVEKFYRGKPTMK